MRRLIFLPIVFCIFSTISNGQQKEKQLKLDIFNKLPSAIDGCSGLYTYDSISLKKKNYLIVTDLQEFAFIKVQGKQITLKRFVGNQLTKIAYRTVYKGGGYTIILITKTGKQIDLEFSMETGTLEISNGIYKNSIKIHGISGC